MDREPPGDGKRILVVEDDDLVRSHVAQLLGLLGYQVTLAATGPEALAILDRGEAVDALFTDMNMPGGLNGRQVAEEARRRRPGLPVLFTSGYTENAIVHSGRLENGMALISKPYRRDELAAKLREILARPAH